MAPSDDELVLASGAGDSQAFKSLVLRHQDRAWTIAHRYLGDAEEARDIVQQAFLRILGNAARFEARGAFGGYLRMVISRLCMDFKSRKRAVPRDHISRVAAPPDSVSSKVRRDMERSAVRRALDHLPPRQRMAVVLRYYDACGYRDIARALGVTEKAAERLLGRGRDRLAQIMGPRVARR